MRIRSMRDALIHRAPIEIEFVLRSEPTCGRRVEAAAHSGGVESVSVGTPVHPSRRSRFRVMDCASVLGSLIEKRSDLCIARLQKCVMKLMHPPYVVSD